MFVLGEYRVGIYAKTALKAGTELIMDYAFATRDSKEMKQRNQKKKKKKKK